MNALTSVLFGLLVVVAVQAKYEFTETAKECIKEIGSDEDTIKSKIMTEAGKVDEDDETVRKFLGCCYRPFISDTNELVVDEKFLDYITKIMTIRTDGRSKLAVLLAKECTKKCEHKKGDTKEATAAKVSNCLMEEFFEYIKQH